MLGDDLASETIKIQVHDSKNVRFLHLETSLIFLMSSLVAQVSQYLVDKSGI